MTKARVVIGAGYGDEGKGLFTDYFLDRTGGRDKASVRFNGGAQAGHTVVTPDHKRHVFHHFGSGALANAATHLSRFFVVNPMTFGGERYELVELGARVDVTVDPAALITTPFDMLVNQIVETVRSDGRHGSCGLGFGETIERNMNIEFQLNAADLYDSADIRARLRHIRANWLPRRLEHLGVAKIPYEFRDLLADDCLIDAFIVDCASFTAKTRLLDDTKVTDLGCIVFEGAQGLMLDMDYGAFPYVTRSNTGLVNVAALAKIAGIGALDVTYAHRAYATRHGAGPFRHEVAVLEGFDVVDETNIQNPWQGTLRFAPLDLDLLAAAIKHDAAIGRRAGIEINLSLGLSCLDQAHSGAATIVEGGVRRQIDIESLPHLVSREIEATEVFESWGPTRATIAPREVDEQAGVLPSFGTV